ncbi:MAG: RNB domain-containing ribonuclease, partial [Actinomycetota bacterium]|nr:RNB domain-containing ribonuclease [Actinomycetota bacterium]
MVARATRLASSARGADGLEAAFAAIRSEHEVRAAFPAEVLEAAERAAASPRLPERDARDIELVTIDPPGAMDLDQALHLERTQGGYRVRYAIADVAAFVTPGDPIDLEAHRRGQTIYCPDARVALHPPVMSEGAASLLPGQDRPAYVWDVALDADGARRSATVYRALVRSRGRLTYTEVQTAVDAGTGGETLELLREVGRLRIARESARGGASLPMPEQEVHLDEHGGYRLELRPLLEAEEWNAQISLLTGIAAAQIMLDGGVGILRTMPPATPEAIARFRREARALGAEWPREKVYGDFLRTLDRDDPRHLAIIHDATSLFRGSGYTVLAGDGSPRPAPEELEQSAIAAPYAHTTAPLRRLVDRYSLAICEALTEGREVPAWAGDGLAGLPEVMAESGRRASAVERACADAVEAAVLAHRVGEVFDAVVVDENRSGLDLQLTDPAVTARADGEAEP